MTGERPVRLRERAPGKVNLCLFLGPTRADGRHELVTVFESVSLADELELVVLEDGPDELICPGIEGPNLISSALAGLRALGWQGPPVRIISGAMRLMLQWPLGSVGTSIQPNSWFSGSDAEAGSSW